MLVQNVPVWKYFSRFIVKHPVVKNKLLVEKGQERNSEPVTLIVLCKKYNCIRLLEQEYADQVFQLSALWILSLRACLGKLLTHS